MKNVELKVIVADHRPILDLLKKNKARKKGVLNQVDVYFNCRSGRLKLREINKRKLELIYYKRKNTARLKISEFKIVSVPAKQKNDLLKLFSDAYGIWRIVEKKRELWMYKNTRVHLDTVEGLGKFLELETVAFNLSLRQARKEQQQVIEFLGLNKYEKVAKSYSDLLGK